VIDRSALCIELLSTWQREIPLAAAMSISVDGYDGRTLSVRAPLAPNRNLHGTAFAGSLFSLCVLTGWGAVWSALREQGLAGLIVVADSRIQYRKAVTGDLVCHCALDAVAVSTELERFKATGRAAFEVGCDIDSGSKRAVIFTGQYVVHAQRH
jgi:thioesterase domain-containing protein